MKRESGGVDEREGERRASESSLSLRPKRQAGGGTAVRLVLLARRKKKEREGKRVFAKKNPGLFPNCSTPLSRDSPQLI